jgi:hypothetical protein
MSSSRDAPDSKEMFDSVRRFSRSFLEHLYAAAEKDGNFLLPQEALAAFFRFLRDQPERPGLLSTEENSIADRLSHRFYRQLCDDALAAYRRHTPGFEKAIPGRKPNAELAERIWALRDEGKTSKRVLAILKADGVNLSLDGVEAYSKTRRRKRGK